MTYPLSAVEYEHIENKQSLNEWREVVESLAAMATARGGTVRIGIAPNGQRVGVQVGRGTIEDLINKIRTNTNPSQYPSLTQEGDEATSVITLRVEESPIKPVWAFGVPFKRVGRTNQRLTPEETKRLMEVTTGRTWDALPCPGLRVEDIDRKAIEGFLRSSGQNIRTSTKGVVENLGLLTGEGLCNGAALLFAKNPQRFIPEAQVKCARFLGTTSVMFLDEQTLDGNVLTQPDKAIAFVARNTQQGIRITGRAERETVPEYPESAVREAIINAICHRDYAVTGTVQIRIYDDRLEVWNPGMLPPDLTVEALYREHPSRPRHPRLANVLHRAKIIEHFGTGTLRIVEACEQRGLPRPEFSSEMGSFITRFKRVAVNPQRTEVSPFMSRQAQAVSYVHVYGGITPGRYRELFDLSERQTLRDLSALVEQGIFIRVGRGPATHYEIAEPTVQREPLPSTTSLFQEEDPHTP